MTNAYFTSIEQYRDVEAHGWYAMAQAAGADTGPLLQTMALRARDNSRTPMCWDASPNAGFTTGTPWLPVNANHTEINAEAARADEDSVFHHYRRLIELRKSSPVAIDGVFALLAPTDEQVFAYTRTLGDESWLVVANLSSAPAVLPQDVSGLAGELLLGTHGSVEGDLAPWESRIVRLA